MGQVQEPQRLEKTLFGFHRDTYFYDSVEGTPCRDLCRCSYRPQRAVLRVILSCYHLVNASVALRTAVLSI
jgi:hypothetical protein